MSLQTIGTCCAGLGLLVAFAVGMRGEEDGLIIVPSVMVLFGVILAVIGRKNGDPV